jgi:hypothetical protein
VDDLSLIFPHPQPVTLGSWSGQAICFQLRDLARLQSIVKSLGGDPLSGKRRELIAAKLAARGDCLGDSAESRAYGNGLRAAIRALEKWPPQLETPEANRLLGTPAGRVLWLDTLLGRPGLNPGFTAKTAALAISGENGEVQAIEDQWLILESIAYADHPADFINRLDFPSPRRSNKAINWGEAIVEFSDRRGWPPDVVGSMYLSQWYIWRSGGKWKPGSPSGPKEYIRAFQQRRQKLMRGDVRRNGQHH